MAMQIKLIVVVVILVGWWAPSFDFRDFPATRLA